ncbi:hypothetical protein CAC42_732 [Sphaceloma murrayae]|uniref:PRISE-like Rossmann-fold domain-containing protein n=1 Tax=Sphaceloma murrayae TaxID=2082308 RepID=A0A2K1QKW1_9PEZI|nr:hypothetical protein CAC42_732 [Sphaceloma murrayae]
MASQGLPARNVGIFRNLPQFDTGIKDLTAIITGANGISGFHTMRALLAAPERWSKIYALSRKPPPDEMMALLTPAERSKVQHVAVDFLSPPQDISKILKDSHVKADYIFYYTYLQPPPPKGTRAWSNADELVKVNAGMLDNFLGALQQANIWPKRVLLQTGAKNYGVHIGRIRLPAIESDPQPKHLEPNFYYPQEESLSKYCEESKGKTSWNVIRPAWIVGAVVKAQINAFYPLAIYSAVQSHLNLPLSFPSDWTKYHYESHHATAFLTGFLSEWAVLNPDCANEAFNAQDTSPVSWDRLFEEFARWYGAPGVQGPPAHSDGDEQYHVLEGKHGKEVPFGAGPPAKHRVTFSFVEWAKQEQNHDAWKEIMRASGAKVEFDPFEDVDENFMMADAAMATMGTLSMNKARRMGWSGFVDTRESLYMMFSEMAQMGLLPEMRVEDARPLV